MTAIDWPTVLAAQSVMPPVLEKNTASSGSSIIGQDRLIATDAGRWRYGVRVPVRTRDQRLSWRALTAQAEGRFGTIRVPVCDVQNDPATVAGIRGPIVRAYRAGIPFSDGATYSDGVGHDFSMVNAVVAATAAAGATSITVTMPSELVPWPGHYFSDGDRLYVVKSATLISGTSYALTFLPRLRAAIPAGAEVSFDRLFCLMRLASDDVLAIELELHQFGEASIEFVEALI